MDFKEMLCYLLLVSFGAVVVANECSDDKYACGSITSAKECHTLSRCLTNVWKDIELQKDSSNQCQTCSALVNRARGYIGNRLLQFEMKMILLNACPLISDKNLANECMNYVRNYFDEVVALIETNADPQIVCAAINVCKAMNTTASEEPILVSHVRIARSDDLARDRDDTKCILCEFIMKEIDSLISNNATEEEILAALEKVCNILPSSIRAECVNFIDTYGPTIFFLLSHELDPKLVCTMIGLCQSAAPSFSLKTGNSEACGMCENIVQYLDSYLVLSGTIDEIDHLLEKICDMMPGDLPAQCKDFVEMYGGSVVYLVAEELDPKTVCTVLGLCKSQVGIIKGAKQGALAHWKSYPCNQGPRHWCVDAQTASACKALGYCKMRVWMQIP